MRYWLMKSEPGECSIDDVAKAPAQTVPWVGVRNYQARNFMRDEMRAKDGVLFYHSSCAEPGIAGLAEVVGKPYPDPTQFDSQSPYFDPKSRVDEPRWVLVDVKLVRKTRLLSLAEMRQAAALASMRVLQRGNRLSITPVSPEEWQAVRQSFGRSVTLGLGWQLVFELLLLGVFSGFLAGLLGIGGGMLMVPFMTLLLTSKGMPAAHVVKIAIATSLATICFTALSSVRSHHKRGAVRWDIAKLLAPGIVVGSLLGAQIARALPATILALVFAAFVGFSATQMLLDRKPKQTRQLLPPLGMLGAGTGIGVLSALVGAGGGFISVPFMAWCNVPMHKAVATSAALGFPIAVAGTVGYVIAGWSVQGLPPGTLGFIYVPALLTIAAASVLTAPIGARFAHRLNVAQLKRAFAALLYALAAYMLFKGIHG